MLICDRNQISCFIIGYFYQQFVLIIRFKSSSKYETTDQLQLEKLTRFM